MVNARQTEEQLSKIAMSTPDEILVSAQQMTDPRLKIRLMQLADKKRSVLLEQRKQEFAEKTAGQKNLPPEVQALQLLNDLHPDSQQAKDIRAWLASKQKPANEWSEPYDLNGVTVQKNLTTGKIDTAVRRAPVTRVSVQGAAGMGKSPGADAEGKIDFSKIKDADKWRIIKEQGADNATILKSKTETDDVASLADRLLKHPGLEAITGVAAMTNWAALPGSKAKGALSILDSLKAKANTVGRALASESGKLGNMAVQEWKIVGDDIANLDPRSPEFANEVARIVKKAEMIEERLRKNYADTYSVYEGLNASLSASKLPPSSVNSSTQRKTKSGVVYTVEP